MRLISQVACISILLAMGAGNVIAQVPQPTIHVHERLLCVVPLVGAGSWADPKRPLFAPRNPSSSGILGYSFVTSDDGKYAIAEFIGKTPAAFAALKGDPGVLVAFEKKKSKKEDVEKELKKYKKDFDYTKLAARLP